MKDFRELKVWEKAHRCVLEVYAATRTFPPDERFGLTSQIRRAAISIPSNLAEGCGRGGDSDFARFVQISIGSASELDYQFLLARDLAYLDETEYAAFAVQVEEVRRMLIGLLKSLTAHRS